MHRAGSHLAKTSASTRAPCVAKLKTAHPVDQSSTRSLCSIREQRDQQLHQKIHEERLRRQTAKGTQSAAGQLRSPAQSPIREKSADVPIREKSADILARKISARVHNYGKVASKISPRRASESPRRTEREPRPEPPPNPQLHHQGAEMQRAWSAPRVRSSTKEESSSALSSKASTVSAKASTSPVRSGPFRRQNSASRIAPKVDSGLGGRAKASPRRSERLNALASPKIPKKSEDQNELESTQTSIQSGASGKASVSGKNERLNYYYSTATSPRVPKKPENQSEMESTKSGALSGASLASGNENVNTTASPKVPNMPEDQNEKETAQTGASYRAGAASKSEHLSTSAFPKVPKMPDDPNERFEKSVKRFPGTLRTSQPSNGVRSGRGRSVEVKEPAALAAAASAAAAAASHAARTVKNVEAARARSPKARAKVNSGLTSNKSRGTTPERPSGPSQQTSSGAAPTWKSAGPASRPNLLDAAEGLQQAACALRKVITVQQQKASSQGSSPRARQRQLSPGADAKPLSPIAAKLAEKVKALNSRHGNPHDSSPEPQQNLTNQALDQLCQLAWENTTLREQLDTQNQRLSDLEERERKFFDEGIFDLIRVCVRGDPPPKSVEDVLEPARKSGLVPTHVSLCDDDSPCPSGRTSHWSAREGEIFSPMPRDRIQSDSGSTSDAQKLEDEVMILRSELQEATTHRQELAEETDRLGKECVDKDRIATDLDYQAQALEVSLKVAAEKCSALELENARLSEGAPATEAHAPDGHSLDAADTIEMEPEADVVSDDSPTKGLQKRKQLFEEELGECW